MISGMSQPVALNAYLVPVGSQCVFCIKFILLSTPCMLIYCWYFWGGGGVGGDSQIIYYIWCISQHQMTFQCDRTQKRLNHYSLPSRVGLWSESLWVRVPRKPGPVFTKGLSQGLGLKLRLFSQVSAQKLKTFVLGLVVFTKNLRPVLALAKGSTLRLVGSGLKFCKEDLNMAAINFSPLQNLKWL